MSSTVLASAAAAARIALAEAAVLKVGQVLQAIVAASASDGLATLKLGDQTVQAQLPQPLPAGTTLQLQVRVGGATPQLAIVSQSPPAGDAVGASAVPAATAPVAPMPPAVAPLMLEPMPNPAAAAEPEAHAAAAAAPANPTGGEATGAAVAGRVVLQIAESTQALAAPSSSAVSAVAPSAAGAAQEASGSAAAPSVAVPVVAADEGPQAATGGPATGNSPATSATSPTASQAPLPARNAGTEAEPPVAVRLNIGPAVPPTSTAEAPAVSAEPALQSIPAATVAVASAPAPAADPAAGTVSAVATPAAPTAAPAAVEAPVEPEVSNPLLLAQSAARPAGTAEIPQAFVAPAAAVARAAGPAPLPPTPEAALAQMVPEAIARQASAGPLLQTLADAVQRPNVLPEPVLRAAMGVLAQRIVVSDGRVGAGAIEQAVLRSGIGLEASLAREAPQPMDAKAGLLALRDALTRWLGDAPTPPARTAADAPPLKGLPLRAFPAEASPLPGVPRDAGGLLHQETDAAISRLKLMQLASLPDPSGNSGRAAAPSLRMELPFLIGHELVMAQMQIGREVGGGRRDAAGRRGWSMRFALNFSATGEVGAEVGLLDKAVSVSLWAAEPETAAAMRETLPDLKGALERIGLVPQSLRIRGAAPEPERPIAGKILDSVS